MAVRAMKAGAIDFIEKPFNDQELLERVQQPWRGRASAARRGAAADYHRRLDMLTPREREVLERVVSATQQDDAAGAWHQHENR